MKKLFFSAIALVAFSSVSMANTIEIEDIKEVAIVANNEITCAKKAIAFLDILDHGNNLSSIDAFFYYRGYVDACMGATANPPRR